MPVGGWGGPLQTAREGTQEKTENVSWRGRGGCRLFAVSVQFKPLPPIPLRDLQGCPVSSSLRFCAFHGAEAALSSEVGVVQGEHVPRNLTLEHSGNGGERATL